MIKTPLEHKVCNKVDYLHEGGEEKKILAVLGSKEYADFILKRCNNYDELVKALESVIENFITTDSYPSFDDNSEKFHKLAGIEIEARQVLKKAKE
jgi:hypothetical protein